MFFPRKTKALDRDASVLRLQKRTGGQDEPIPAKTRGHTLASAVGTTLFSSQCLGSTYVNKTILGTSAGSIKNKED